MNGLLCVPHKLQHMLGRLLQRFFKCRNLDPRTEDSRIIFDTCLL